MNYEHDPLNLQTKVTFAHDESHNTLVNIFYEKPFLSSTSSYVPSEAKRVANWIKCLSIC